jgi:tetratricopeptide (TPR) repeat protein
MPQGQPEERLPVNAPAAQVPSRYPALREAARQPPHIPDHELLRRIGAGSYGEVWLARSVMGTLRAVKIVHRASFDHERPYEREYAGIQKFEPVSRSHDGLVDILQVGRDDEAGYFYYVMELADDAEDKNEKGGKGAGENNASTTATPHPFSLSPLHPFSSASYIPRTLRCEISHRGRLSVDECVALGLSLARALAHLHAQGLVHRDIKPSNIIFVGGVPKLADIGLVTVVSEARSYVGTAGFIPPEGPGSPAADLFSLGKVLYEASTGKDRQDFPEPLTNLGDQPDKDRLLEFNAILHRACQSDPRERYQGAEEMLAELELLQRGESVKQKRAAERRWTITKKWGLAAVTLAALIAAVPISKIWNRDRAPNPEAVRLFELGRWYHNQFTEEGQTKALQCLNQAVQIEPKFADAYRLLFEINIWDSDSDNKSKINRELAAKLMALDPKLAEAHAALSWNRHVEGDWPGAEQEIQTAIKLNPNYSEARCLYGYFLSLLGRVEEAIPQMQRARDLDPTSRLHATAAGFPFIAARQFDLAITQFCKALELDTNFALAHLWIGKALEAKGEYLEALGEFEKNAIFSGVDETKARQRFDRIRQAYSDAGPRGYWLKVLDFQTEGEASHDKSKLSEQDRWPLQGVYAQLGENGKALDLLEKLLKQGAYGAIYWLKFDPIYEPLRDEPRFRAVVKKLGLDK